ncbi:hypothetical protein HMI56_003682 [Coelomomyces lativittatus]|nr:hypothetical protein HMI56_003682 [Coelomomyces lativittatus]
MTSRAHVTQLRRTCQGEWKEEDLLDFESITFENIVRHLRPVSEKIVEVPSAV